MVAAPEYNLRTQAKIPLALACLHNFIRISDPDDEAHNDNDYNDEEADNTRVHNEINPEHLGQHISSAEKDRASAARDTIAMAMWEDYLSKLAEREVQ